MVVPEPTADRPRPSAIPRVASLASPPIKVGMQVSVSGARGSLTGTVRFVGVTQFATGEWIGVDLGKPDGRNDGSVNDVRYFDYEPKCGLLSSARRCACSGRRPGRPPRRQGRGGGAPAPPRPPSKTREDGARDAVLGRGVARARGRGRGR